MKILYAITIVFLVSGAVLAHRGDRFDNGEEDRFEGERRGRGGRHEGEKHGKDNKSFLCWLVFCPEGFHCEVLNEPSEWFIFSWVYCAEDQSQNGTTIATGSTVTGESPVSPESTDASSEGNPSTLLPTVAPPEGTTSL